MAFVSNERRLKIASMMVIFLVLLIGCDLTQDCEGTWGGNAYEDDFQQLNHSNLICNSCSFLNYHRNFSRNTEILRFDFS